jgi:hypothetical protein
VRERLGDPRVVPCFRCPLFPNMPPSTHVVGLRSLATSWCKNCGFNLHAKTHAGAVDDDARARLLRYVLRPPLAQERLTVLPDHRVRLTLKRPWSDGDGRGAAAWGRGRAGRP